MSVHISQPGVHSSQIAPSSQAEQSNQTAEGDLRGDNSDDRQNLQQTCLADSFPLFGSLPHDIQTNIWEIAKDTPRHYILNGLNIRDHGEGRTIQVRITQAPYYQPIPDVPIVGRQAVPPGRYSYKWRLRTSNRPNKLDFISRNTWNDYQRRWPHRLELRDDTKSEVVRFDANRDTIFMDIDSLFSLSDYATPIGELGPGGQTYGQGPPKLTRNTTLIGFENIQRLAVPTTYCTSLQGFNWLLENVFTGIYPSIPGIDTLPGDEAPHPSTDPRPSIQEDFRISRERSSRLTRRWVLRDLLIRHLRNIFQIRRFSRLPIYTHAFIAAYDTQTNNREGAVREFFKYIPKADEGAKEHVEDDPNRALPCTGPEAPASGELLTRYDELLREFHQRGDSEDNDFSDSDDDGAGMLESRGEPSRRQHHLVIARRKLDSHSGREAVANRALAFSTRRMLLVKAQKERKEENLESHPTPPKILSRFSTAGAKVDIRKLASLRRKRDEGEMGWVKSIASYDGTALENFEQVMKRMADNIIRWSAYSARMEMILEELEEIHQQVNSPELAIWDPAKWVSKAG